MELTPSEVDDILLWKLVRAAHAADRYLSEALTPLSLTPVQFGVLAQLAVQGPLTQADLARAVMVRPQSVAGIVDGLVARGLLAREVTRTKGRRNPLSLSQAGQALLAEAWPVMVGANAPGPLGMDDAAARTLSESLTLVLTATGNR